MFLNKKTRHPFVIKLVVLGLFFVLLITTRSYCMEYLRSADFSDFEKVQISVGGTSVKEDVSFDFNNGGMLLIPTNNGSLGVSNQTNSKLDVQSEFNEKFFRMFFKPEDSTIVWRTRLGTIDQFRIDFSSGASRNAFQSLKNNLVWGLGLSWQISPGSDVSQAVTLDFDYENKSIRLDRFESDGTHSGLEKELDQEFFQAGINVSQRFKKIEPYLGLKYKYFISNLIDLESKDKLRGTTQSLSPFLGLKWNIQKSQFFSVEGSFLKEKSLSGSVNLSF